MRIIAFLNQKGGVGKTTSILNVGAGLAQAKKKVLLIDCDPQASLSYSLGIEPQELPYTLHDFISNRCLYEQVALKKHSLSLIPGSIALSGFEKEYAHVAHKEHILKKALKNVPNFDYILLDCPPSLGLITLNALAAAQEILVPVQAEFLALQGLSQLMDTLKVIQERINPTLRICGILGTRVNRRKIHHDVIEFLQVHFRDQTFKTFIRENIALAESPSFGKTIYEHAHNSNGAYDYTLLCKEIMKQERTR